MLIYICEDIEAHQVQLVELLKEMAEEMQWKLEIKTFASGESLFSEVKRSVPEVIFSDIAMPGMDGITLGKALQRIAPQSCLVLLTAFPEYAIRGYETRAYRYLLKPADKEEIRKIFVDIFARKEKEKWLVVQNTEEEKLIAIQSVRYMKAEDKYIIIHTTEGAFLDRLSLQHYEVELQNFGFFRMHRKYLINMRYHKSIEGGNVILDNDEKLPISRRKVAAYHACFLKMLEGGWLK